MELQHLSSTQRGVRRHLGDPVRLGIGLLFGLAVMLYAATMAGIGGAMIAVAAVMGCYMALNIGANDVANNVGPAVGAGVLSLPAALSIAAIFEAAGALLAGGEVIGTLRSGVIDASRVADPQTFGWVMTSALLAGGLWLNIATAVGAPVSTTHSIVGAVLGAGIAASGAEIVHWDVMGAIAVSWVVSPLLGAVVAAAFLYAIKRSILYQHDMLAAATRAVPRLIALMTWAFTTYLLVMGGRRGWPLGLPLAALLALLPASAALLLLRPVIARRARMFGNTKKGINRLFDTPLMVAAALLSFAHGSNDVANAVGPLAAVVHVVQTGGIPGLDTAPVPFWTMIVGAAGICLGLALYGPRVIRTIGSEITELDQMRAFSIAMSAAVTVIIASALGLPVSSTHIVVGGVFGVGFLREYLKRNYARTVAEIRAHHPQEDQAAIDAFLLRFEAASIDEKGAMLRDLKVKSKQRLDPANFSKQERKGLRRVYEDELVRRTQVVRIVFAWIVTVPASAALAIAVFHVILGLSGH